MGFIASLFCVCFVAFIGLLWGVKLYARFYPTSFLHHQELTTAVALYGAFLFGGLLLSIFSFLPFSSLAIWCISGLAVLGLECSSFPKKWKIIFSFLLCLSNVLSLYQFDQNAVLGSFLMALLWLGIWRLWVLFDHFPFVSFLTSISWTIALVLVGIVMHTIPTVLLIPVALIGSGVVAASYFQLVQRKAILGYLTSSLAGFVWAGVWVYFLTTGSFFQVLTAFGYYIFEGVVLGVAFYLHRPLQTYLGRMLSFPQLASKAVSVVFSHLLILSFLAAMTLHMKFGVAPVLIFALVVVLVDLSLRLNVLVHPQPSWKELLKNTKDSLSVLVKQVKDKKNISSKKTKKTQKKRKKKK